MDLDEFHELGAMGTDQILPGATGQRQKEKLICAAFHNCGKNQGEKSQGKDRKWHKDVMDLDEFHELGAMGTDQILPGATGILTRMASSKLQALWNHPAGPKTIHFWAPTFKWGISIANVADFAKPPETLSYPQQIVVTVTGGIWSRYSGVITPKNWNLMTVSVAMAGTGVYQLSRKIRHDYFDKKEAAVERN
uniref:Mitochondrial pyruvate carrier n=2 Tax=Daucus carota subsp. sativus TaxID=79200 RepID=A0A166H052_DAUCS